MTGGPKPGPAAADAVRDRQKHAQDETREALRRLRESVADDEGDRPSVQVHVHPPTVKTALDSIAPPGSLRRSLVPSGPKGIATAIAAVFLALAALAKAIAEVLQ